MRLRIGPRSLLGFGAMVLGTAIAAAKEDAWRHDTAAAFAKARKDGVVVSDSGTVRLARPVHSLGKLDAERVWALARGKNGAIFAATGDEGRVFRREAGGEWADAFDAEDTQALSLAAT